MQPKMPEWCQKRITGIELKVRFGDGKHRFYLESVCAAPVLEAGRKLCDACRMLQVQTKTQDVKTFPHGFVLSEYSEESHIFDSPWYHSKLEAYGRPSDVDVAMAMEAQRRARRGVPTKAMKDLIDILIAGASKGEQIKEVEEVIVGIPLTAPLPASSDPPTVKPKSTSKAKAKAKAKSKGAPTPAALAEVPRPHIEALSPVCTEISKDISFVESTDEPMEVEVVKVVLKKFEHGGIQLWRDDEGGVLYERLANGSKGSWIGRWDSMSKCIVYA